MPQWTVSIPLEGSFTNMHFGVEVELSSFEKDKSCSVESDHIRGPMRNPTVAL